MKFSNQSVNQRGNFGDFAGEQTTTSFRTNRPGSLVVDEPNPYSNILFGGNSDGINKWDTGHTFSTEKRRAGSTHYDYFYGKPYSAKLGDSGYRGPLWVWNASTPQYPTAPSWSVSDQNFYGAQAIRDTVPTGTSAHLLEALGQLAAGQEIPRVIGYTLIPLMSERINVFRKLGAEYLNYQYGWLTYIQDIKELLHAVSNANSILTQYMKDSGKVVRRSRVYHTQSSAPVLVASGVANMQWPNNSEFFSVPSGKYSVYDTFSVTYKFTGAYSYFVPDLDLNTINQYASLADHLLGLKLTPSVLWELSPWTWLTDWMANIGSLLFNASAFSKDNLVMRWGYLQRHSFATRTHTLEGIQFNGGPKLTISNTFSIEKKERIRATPYGFGLNPATFTDRQWAILAAIGLTIGPKKLR
jgi:hypothetical protein